MFEVALLAFNVAVILYAFIKVYNEPMALLFVFSLFGYISYLQLYCVRIIFQFNKCDKGKKIIINAERTRLTMIQGNVITEIINEEVDRVEIYEQKSLGKFGRYNYTKHYGALIITKFTVPYIME